MSVIEFRCVSSLIAATTATGSEARWPNAASKWSSPIAVAGERLRMDADCGGIDVDGSLNGQWPGWETSDA
jgi:hypothetical protein